MSVLPSREDAKDWSDRYAEVVNDRSMVRIVAAYASGRLVDREAIDYEAGWGYLRSESARPIDSDELVWIDKVDFMAAVAAAIGDTDEP